MGYFKRLFNSNILKVPQAVKKELDFSKFSSTDVESVVKARKQSSTLGGLFDFITNYQTQQQQKIFDKSHYFSKRATGPDGYLHPEFTVDNIQRVMQANKNKHNPDLMIEKGTFNTYNPKNHKITIVDPTRPDTLGHEMQHHVDNLKGDFKNWDIVQTEESAFTTQRKIAKEMNIEANMPFDDPKKSAETYRGKSQKRYDEKK